MSQLYGFESMDVPGSKKNHIGQIPPGFNSIIPQSNKRPEQKEPGQDRTHLMHRDTHPPQSS